MLNPKQDLALEIGNIYDMNSQRKKTEKLSVFLHIKKDEPQSCHGFDMMTVERKYIVGTCNDWPLSFITCILLSLGNNKLPLQEISITLSITKSTNIQWSNAPKEYTK